MRIKPWDVGRLAPEQKLCTIDEVSEIVNGNSGLKRIGRPVVFASGVFDVLHLGHMQFIHGAAKFGVVVVGLENDEAVKLNKGSMRPINLLRERMLAIASMQEVGLVFGFDDVLQYSDPASYAGYVERYRKVSPLFLAIPEGDPNGHMKILQAEEAGFTPPYGSSIVPVTIPGHYPNSTTAMLQKVGFQE